ncbi:hypothetical protein R3P38DRAFT_3237615 [Favolaschia claudopus]|uniref:Uncharacterized protein n=1 Tax=Favolaschia claudopus TaxID=2862362 RepID=A0AAV9ZAB0_9AGAR
MNDSELASLRAQLARVEQSLADLVAREEALYAYIEDAVAPLEKGVRRVERRVGKLKNNVKKQREEVIVLGNAGAGGKGKGKGKSGMTNTIFVPAAGAGAGGGGGLGHGAQEAAKAIIRSWFGAGEEGGSAPPGAFSAGNGNGNVIGRKGKVGPIRFDLHLDIAAVVLRRLDLYSSSLPPTPGSPFSLSAPPATAPPLPIRPPAPSAARTKVARGVVFVAGVGCVGAGKGCGEGGIWVIDVRVGSSLRV